MPARHPYRASGLVQVPLCEGRDYEQAFARESVNAPVCKGCSRRLFEAHCT